MTRYRGAGHVFRASSYAALRIVSYHNNDTNGTDLYCILQREMLWFRFGAVNLWYSIVRRSRGGVQHNATGGRFFHARCALTRFLKTIGNCRSGAACCQAGPARVTMRKKLGGIPPGPCDDCLVAFFCLQCMLVRRMSHQPSKMLMVWISSEQSHVRFLNKIVIPHASSSTQSTSQCQMKRELKIRGLHGSGCVDEFYVQSRVADSHIAPGVPVMKK